MPAAPIPLPEGAGHDPREQQEYARLRKELVRAVARVCPPWLAGRAEDLVHAALLKLLAHPRVGGAPLEASYLQRAAYSVMVDEIRRLRRYREVSLEEAASTPATAAADPEQAERAREIGVGLEDCLRLLPEGRRMAVTLHLQGHTVPEAARILGWGAKAVDNLVYRGLADLRRCLTGKGLQP